MDTITFANNLPNKQLNSFTELADEFSSQFVTPNLFPRYILLIDNVSASEEKELRTKQFLKLKEGVYYSYDTHGLPIQHKLVENIVTNRKPFVLTSTVSSWPTGSNSLTAPPTRRKKTENKITLKKGVTTQKA